MRSRRVFWILAATAFLGVSQALGQAPHHPFAIGASEGAVGHQSGFGAWILAKESGFYLLLTGALRDARGSVGAALGLAGISFAYGVFHAAGPGHGKAVISSYMISNEVALRRGLVIALLAALLQGFVAVALVGIAALIFNATAARMTQAAEILELSSYAGIVTLGVVLVGRKSRAILAARRPAAALLLADTGGGMIALPESSRFSADDGLGDHVHGPDCGHVHMPDPRILTGARFNWKAAAVTVATAGARPCSGAILVLVFSLAQGMFWAGVGATFAMSAGTALTTGALAISAVYFKGFAMRIVGGDTGRAALIGRLIELAAAACVLAFGLALLIAALAGVHHIR